MIYLDNEDVLDQAYNFAMEEYALRFLDENETYFMFYRMKPTIIVGKNQNTLEEINHSFVKEHNIDVLRRLSGGGAVYNDEGNISFSMITKDDGNSFQNFARFTEPVIQALQKLGVNAKLSGRNDIEVDGKKISGNAQFATKGRLYSHGTLLFDVDLSMLEQALQVDPEKYLSKGVKSVRSRVTTIREHLAEDMDIQTFKQILLESIFETTDIPKYNFTAEDKIEIEKLRTQRYRNWDWTYGKSPKATIKRKKRFPAGTIEFQLSLNKGQVAEAIIYGDFFGTEDVSELAAKLIGCRFERAAVQHAWENVNTKAYFGNVEKEAILDMLFE
ncbi:TPA: lipoate protein ligase LplA2 [Listeria innocua]|uniref:lipoate protein ligase LplA2 n=1 Tax=Listeria innocua TaxID=1642 RepID=UPI000D87DFB6|nr:lipoate protein ligase LplA2 [Listeria innocua]EAD5764005.1 lipoate--protein ligase [Listeria innocua]EAE2436059.1 lipoate--protein ligase [Listeria innocua]EAG8533170.1 lipoate--protein ligase [Listeria innocua]ECC1772855.1 lipoate--protein ligase [Listeria innocua]EDO1139532.1 lipoate--protein ligase [Listeria innocua]